MFDLPRVWKFPLPLDHLTDVIEVQMPDRAKVVSVVNQRELLCLYAVCDPQARLTPRKFRVAGTDHPLQIPVNSQFIGTAVFMGGDFVVHVWELDS